jgi:hypothetical protein
MKRKYLYALTLLLALSTVAFSNERARLRCRTAGKKPCVTATPCTTATPRVTAASPNAAATEEAPGTSENHVFLHTFIKLLYI